MGVRSCCLGMGSEALEAQSPLTLATLHGDRNTHDKQTHAIALLRLWRAGVQGRPCRASGGLPKQASFVPRASLHKVPGGSISP